MIKQIRPWHLVTLIYLIYLPLVFFINDSDLETYVQIGDCYSHCGRGIPPDCDFGYDGQFAYYIARDPGGAAPCMDVDSYRYQRIFLPILGYVFSLGNEDIVPLIFVLINLTAVIIGTILLEKLLEDMEVSPWFALVYSLFIGIMSGVRISTVEPLAYGLVIAGIWLGQRERPWLQAIALSLAVLTKETTAPFIAGYLVYYFLHHRWKDILRLSLITGIPFILWQIYLYTWLGSPGVGSGGDAATPFEIIPYNGIWSIGVQYGLGPMLAISLLVVPPFVLPSIWGLWVTGREIWQQKAETHLYTWLFFWNLILMPTVPQSTYREPLGIIRFVIGMILMHILYAGLRYKGQRPLNYSFLWLMYTMMLIAFR